MRYGPNRSPPVEVTIFYDKYGGRACKTFTNEFTGKRFYTAQHIAGKHPSIRIRYMAKKETTAVELWERYAELLADARQRRKDATSARKNADRVERKAADAELAAEEAKKAAMQAEK